MMPPILAMRAALRAILQARNLAVLDEARDAVMPYASFGDCTVRLWQDEERQFAEHRFAIHVWSRAPGDAEALDLSSRIAAEITNSQPPNDVIQLVHWTVTGHEIRRPTREGVRHATLRIQALSEHPKGGSS